MDALTDNQLPLACLERLERLKHCSPTDPHSFQIELAGLLEDLSEVTGYPAIARAARAFHQQSPGRPAIDDSRAIDEALFLYEQGETRSLSQALHRVARRVDPYGDRKSWRNTAERLRKKCVKMNKVSGKTF